MPARAKRRFADRTPFDRAVAQRHVVRAAFFSTSAWRGYGRGVLAPIATAVLALLAPTPGELLLDLDVRTEFVETVAPRHLRVAYLPPQLGDVDPAFTPRLEVHAVLTSGPDGEPVLFAPAARVAGATALEVLLPDGRSTPAEVVLPAGDGLHDLPLAVIRVHDASMLSGLVPMGWAPDEGVADGARAWLVERAPVRGPDGELPAPVLVDLVLGPRVEHPLERFRYASVRHAEGLPLLDAGGRVLCIIYRGVRGTDPPLSLCAPREAALAPYRAPDPAQPRPTGGDPLQDAR